MRCLRFALGMLLAAAFAPSANASQIVSTSTVSGLRLAVNDRGEALISYEARHKPVHVLAWGAVNAVAPTADGKQAALRLDYSGGYAKYFRDDPQVRKLVRQYRKIRGTPGYLVNPVVGKLKQAHLFADTYWQTAFKGTCARYDGPALAWAVAACKAPDGSYWAVQEWQRKLPDYGLAPSALQAGMEVHLSHWRGVLPVLTIDTDWAWHRWDHLYGTFVYNGTGVFGFRSTASGQPLDRFGRNLYVDTFDSTYGPGWKRENSFLTHKGTGAFCYSLNPHGANPAGKGTEYRATIIGPGITPDVMWEAVAPGAYNPNADAESNLAIAALHDNLCHPN